MRTVKYRFGPDFFRLKNIGTTLEFTIGPEPVPNFRMIERHYFRDQLIKSFDFKFGFCIPNSRNSWESLYPLPEFDEELKKEMIAAPWETKSDSFYFVNEELVMHNRAEYDFSEF